MRVTRREAFLGLGAIGASIAVAGGDAASVGATSPSRALATDVPEGTKLHSCTLARVLPARDGTLPVVIVDSTGAEHELEIMRFDADAPGVAQAGSLAVYVNNGGDGSTATHEEHGLAAMALAAEIARRQARGLAVPKLATLSERRAAGLRTA